MPRQLQELSKRSQERFWSNFQAILAAFQGQFDLQQPPGRIQQAFDRGRRQEGVSPLNPATELTCQRRLQPLAKRCEGFAWLLSFVLTHDFVHQSFKQSFSAPIPVYWYRPIYPLPTGVRPLSAGPPPPPASLASPGGCPLSAGPPFGTSKSIKIDQEAPKRPPRAIKSTFFRLQEPPRALQEAFKRLSAAITHQRCNWKPLYIDFDLQNKPPGPLKSSNTIVLCTTFVVLPFGASPLGLDFGPSWPPFGEPLGTQDG